MILIYFVNRRMAPIASITGFGLFVVFVLVLKVIIWFDWKLRINDIPLSIFLDGMQCFTV